MHYRVVLLVGMMMAAMPALSHAQNAAVMRPFSQVHTIDGYVNLMMDIANKGLSEAKNSKGLTEAPISVMERQIGIIPVEDAQRVIDRGVLSAMAYACGYDWEKDSYGALMARERSSMKWADRQLAYIGLLHGVSMGYVEARMKTNKEMCSVEMHKDVDQYLHELKTANTTIH